MKKFLADLVGEIEGVQPADFREPKLGLKSGEELIGILPDALKPFFATMCNHHDRVTATCASVHKKIGETILDPHTTLESPEIVSMVEHHLAHEKADLVGKLFWHGVYEAFPVMSELAESQKRPIGIRKDWQVVICPRQEPAGISVFDILVMADQ